MRKYNLMGEEEINLSQKMSGNFLNPNIPNTDKRRYNLVGENERLPFSNKILNPTPVNQNTQNQQNIQNIPQTPKIQGMDAVKFRDEPSGNLDLTYDNFQNIYRKQARGEKLGLAEQNFLTDLKLKSQFEGKSMQEIF